MKLVVLVDNGTLVGYDYLGEPALSFFLEDDGIRIMFDCGSSDAAVKNAKKMGVNLLDMDYVVFSHNHYDHAGGFLHLEKLWMKARPGEGNSPLPVVVAHQSFFSNRVENGKKTDSALSRTDLDSRITLHLTEKPFWISEKMVFLGSIPRKNDFESKIPVGKISKGNAFVDDFILDDSAMVYKSPEGLVVITGCSHSGICNIVEYAKQVCKDGRILDVLGGFHLLNPGKAQLMRTVEYFSKNPPVTVHACHCTDLESKIALAGSVNLKEVGSGLVLEYK